MSPQHMITLSPGNPAVGTIVIDDIIASAKNQPLKNIDIYGNEFRTSQNKHETGDSFIENAMDADGSSNLIKPIIASNN